KAHQDTVERKARAQLATEAEARIAQTAACVDGARQAMRSISTTRAKSADVSAAKGALARTEAGLKQARELLAQNDPQGALGRLGRGDELFDANPRGHQMNEGEKGLAQFLIPCGNASKLFEFVKEPFHLLP